MFTASTAYADTVPLVINSNLPGVLEPRVTDGAGAVFGFDNSVAGTSPVSITSQTTTQTGSTVASTRTTFVYTQEFPKAKTATELANYINGLNAQQLTNIQTGSSAGAPVSSTSRNAPVTGPVISLTNLGASAKDFSETIYFHAQQYQTNLVGGVPGQGGTGVIATTLTNGVAGTASGQSTTQGTPQTARTFGAFSTPTLTVLPASANGHGALKYQYTWSRIVTTTVTTPFTDSGVTHSTIQNVPATVAAFSNLTFSLVSIPGAWSSAPAVNNAQGGFTASQFTDTVYSTNQVFVGPASATAQYLMLPNTGTPGLPTLYPIHHADEYAFVISGTLAPYSTGELRLNVSAVPEPSTWALMLLGFGGLGLAGWRAARKDAALPA